MKQLTIAHPVKLVSKLHKLLKQIFICGISATAIALSPQSVLGAERLRFHYGLLEFDLEIDALELFARKGKVNSQLHFYTKRLDDKTIMQLRRILRRRIKINPILLYRLTRSPMVAEIIQNLGEVATTHQGHNGFYAIRGSATNAMIAQKKQGITLIDVLREFPSENILINTSRLLELQKELTTLVEYREAIKQLVIQQASNEASATLSNKFVPKQDLRASGRVAFTEQIINIDSRIARTQSEIRSKKTFRVHLYLPQLSQPAPIVILSHGFGSEPNSFDYLGEHLASYGIAAVSVEHIGSNSDYEQEILEGTRKEAIASQEFIERPLDIQYVLDKLEQLNQSDATLKGTLDLTKVGMIGHSLGGYTTLALSGAEINAERLRQQCPRKKINLNMSLLMQCRAKDLTFQHQLADSRIDVAIAISPISSAIFGQESLTNISIPIAIVSGSEDTIAPVVQEQIYPFTWLKAKDKYLAMMIPGDHFFSSNLSLDKRDSPSIVEELLGQRLTDGKPYIKAFTIAFIKAHLEQKSEYLSYLTASYAQDNSNEQLNFKVINSLDIELLEQEYNDILPLIFPSLE